MKKFKSSLEQESSSKPVIKINVFYILVFQLFGFGLTLFLENQPLENDNSEIHFVFEKTQEKVNDTVAYQVCTQENCRYFGP